MTLPNIITLIRILLIPVFLTLFFSAFPYHRIFAALVLVISGFTDFLDGFIARRLHQTSNLGKLIDPLADKLTMISAFTALYIMDLISIWIMGLILLREISILIGAFLILRKRKELIEPSKLGKYTTAVLYLTALSFVVNFRLNFLLILLAVLLALFSGIGYFISGLKVFIRE